MSHTLDTRAPVAEDTSDKSAYRAKIDQLLAEAETIRSISAADVAQIGARHGVNLGQQLAVDRRELFRRFLEHCLIDYRLGPRERDDLDQLRGILHLPEWEAAEIHDEVVRRVYRRALEAVLEDGRLDPGEEAFIGRLREDLEIPLVTAEGMLQKAWRERRHAETSEGGPPVNGKRLVGSSETSIEDAVVRALAGRGVQGRLSLVEIQVDARQDQPPVFYVALERVAGREG